MNLNFLEKIYTNPSTIATFLVNSSLKGPSSAIQGLVGGQVIDNCTSYVLKKLDERNEKSHFKSNPIKINTEENDFNLYPKTSPTNIILSEPKTIKTIKPGIKAVIIAEIDTIEAENSISSTKTPPPITKLHPYKSVISTTTQISLSFMIAGPTATLSSVAINGLTGLIVDKIKNQFKNKIE